MNEEKIDTADVEKMLRHLANIIPVDNLRLFGCQCCRNITTTCKDDLFEELIDFGQSRSCGLLDTDRLALLRTKASNIYDRLYPGYGAPSAKALAFSAAGEVAFTESSLIAAINAAEFAAKTAGTVAAGTSSDIDFDLAFERAYASERAIQMQLLKRL